MRPSSRWNVLQIVYKDTKTIPKVIMASQVEKARHFILLLLESTDLQAKVLLQTINNQQVTAISEVVYNLLQGSFTLTSTLKAELQKSKSLFRTVGSKKFSVKERRAVIIRNKHLFTKLLRTLGKQLKQVLS